MACLASGPLRLQVDASMVQPPRWCNRLDDARATSSGPLLAFTDAEARCVMAHDSWAAAGESQAPAIAGSRRAGRLAEAVEQLSSVELLQEHVSLGERGRRPYIRERGADAHKFQRFLCDTLFGNV